MWEIIEYFSLKTKQIFNNMANLYCYIFHSSQFFIIIDLKRKKSFSSIRRRKFIMSAANPGLVKTAQPPELLDKHPRRDPDSPLLPRVCVLLCHNADFPRR